MMRQRKADAGSATEVGANPRENFHAGTGGSSAMQGSKSSRPRGNGYLRPDLAMGRALASLHLPARKSCPGIPAFSSSAAFCRMPLDIDHTFLGSKPILLASLLSLEDEGAARNGSTPHEENCRRRARRVLPVGSKFTIRKIHSLKASGSAHCS
jgi:hypothetical protein